MRSPENLEYLNYPYSRFGKTAACIAGLLRTGRQRAMDALTERSQPKLPNIESDDGTRYRIVPYVLQHDIPPTNTVLIIQDESRTTTEDIRLANGQTWTVYTRHEGLVPYDQDAPQNQFSAKLI